MTKTLLDDRIRHQVDRRRPACPDVGGGAQAMISQGAWRVAPRPHRPPILDAGQRQERAAMIATAMVRLRQILAEESLTRRQRRRAEVALVRLRRDRRALLRVAGPTVGGLELDDVVPSAWVAGVGRP